MGALWTDSVWLLVVCLFFAAIGVICAAAAALVRAFRKAARIDARTKPPVPGQPPRPVEAVTGTAPGNPVLRAAPAPGSRSYRAPGGADLGPCRVTIHHCDKGMVVLNHGLRTRRVIPAREESESDRAYLARLEREMGQP